VHAIGSLRRLRTTAAEIAEVLGLALSTVSLLWLKQTGLGKRSRLQPLEPPYRYQRRHASEVVPCRHQSAGAHPLSAEQATAWWVIARARSALAWTASSAAWLV
jgi:hypothetical protein